MQDFTGRTAVVTGGGSGIGRGIALGLANEGMRVALLDLNLDGDIDPLINPEPRAHRRGREQQRPHPGDGAFFVSLGELVQRP